jgi:hypothetical protein
MSAFVAASGLTNLSDGVATVAWAWLASLLPRDPLLIALVPEALRLPWFLAALPGLTVRLLDGPLPRGTALEAPFYVAAVGALALGVWGWGALERGFSVKGALAVDTPPESS